MSLTWGSRAGEQSLLGELVEHGLGYRKEDPGQSGRKDPVQASKKEQDKKTTGEQLRWTGRFYYYIEDIIRLSSCLSFRVFFSKKTVVPRAPLKGRKKKRCVDDSESDWSDDSRESPVPSKPGKLYFLRIPSKSDKGPPQPSKLYA